MYSKNDYRYYLEHRMSEENHIAHFGIKGMKWRNRKDSSYRLESALLTGSGVSRIAADVGVNNARKEQASSISNNDNQNRQDKSKQLKKKSKKTSTSKKRKKLFTPKNRKVDIESFKDEKTGIDYKKR